jgi:hypothetical protein
MAKFSCPLFVAVFVLGCQNTLEDTAAQEQVHSEEGVYIPKDLDDCFSLLKRPKVRLA